MSRGMRIRGQGFLEELMSRLVGGPLYLRLNVYKEASIALFVPLSLRFLTTTRQPSYHFISSWSILALPPNRQLVQKSALH